MADHFSSSDALRDAPVKGDLDAFHAVAAKISDKELSANTSDAWKPPLELRIERARTTKDVDLRMVGSPDDTLARLQEAGRRDLGDFLTFEVGPDEDRSETQNDGMQYDGLRFRAECKLAGKVYGQPFSPAPA